MSASNSSVNIGGRKLSAKQYANKIKQQIRDLIILFVQYSVSNVSKGEFFGLSVYSIG